MGKLSEQLATAAETAWSTSTPSAAAAAGEAPAAGGDYKSDTDNGGITTAVDNTSINDNDDDQSSISPESLIYLAAMASSSTTLEEEKNHHSSQSSSTSSSSSSQKFSNPSPSPTSSFHDSDKSKLTLKTRNHHHTTEQNRNNDEEEDDVEAQDIAMALEGVVPPNLSRAGPQQTQPGAFRGNSQIARRLESFSSDHDDDVTSTLSGALSSLGDFGFVTMTNDPTTTTTTTDETLQQQQQPVTSAARGQQQHRHHHRYRHHHYHRTVLEATLVTEENGELNNNHAASSDDEEEGLGGPEQRHNNKNVPVYTGELIVNHHDNDVIEEYKDIGELDESDNVVPIRKVWIWSILWIGCCLLIITAVAIGSSVVVLQQQQQESNNDPSNENNRTAPALLSSTDPVGPVLFHNNNNNNVAVEDIMGRYNRITHHVALLSVANTANGQCTTLRDSSDVVDIIDPLLLTDSTISVTLSCGGGTNNGVDSRAAIYVYDIMDHCERQSNATIRCLVLPQRPQVLFTCGTYQEDYNGVVNVVSSLSTTTASVQIHSTESQCNPNGNDSIDWSVYKNSPNNTNDVGMFYRPDYIPLQAVFVAVGRMCPPTMNHNNLLRFDNHTCRTTTLDDNNNNDATTSSMMIEQPSIAKDSQIAYCIQQQVPCSTQNCIVSMPSMGMDDTNNEEDCQSSTLKDSLLYNPYVLMMTSSSESSTMLPTANETSSMVDIQEQMDMLQREHGEFVDYYMDAWFCDPTTDYYPIVRDPATSDP